MTTNYNTRFISLKYFNSNLECITVYCLQYTKQPLKTKNGISLPVPKGSTS